MHSASNGDELEVYKGHHGPVHAISYVSLPFNVALHIMSCMYWDEQKLMLSCFDSHLMASCTHRDPKTVLSGYGRRHPKHTGYGSMTVMQQQISSAIAERYEAKS